MDMFSVGAWEVFESVVCIEKHSLPLPFIKPFAELSWDVFEDAVHLLGKDIFIGCGNHTREQNRNQSPIHSEDLSDQSINELLITDSGNTSKTEEQRS